MLICDIWNDSAKDTMNFEGMMVMMMTMMMVMMMMPIALNYPENDDDLSNVYSERT